MARESAAQKRARLEAEEAQRLADEQAAAQQTEQQEEEEEEEASETSTEESADAEQEEEADEEEEEEEEQELGDLAPGFARLLAPEGVTTISHDGNEYEVIDGTVDVPVSAVADLASHGFR